MKNTAEKNTAVNSKVNNNITDKKADYTVSDPKASNLPVISAVKKDEPKKAEVPASIQTEQPKVEAPQAEQPKAEAPKAEPKAEPQPEPKPVKHVMNLEETLKLVAELNRRKIQRDKLMETIENLEAFEVEIKEDADETDGNIYQGCVLTIEDDNRRKFTTKNPVIIWTVAQQVNSMCVNKLSEIEAGIILP
jgi:hypothetical protein